MKLLDLPQRPSALLATSYSLTVGSLMALNERGIRIPDEMSFIGFEVLDIGRVMVPRLHVVATPLEELGRSAASLLYGRIKEEGKWPPEVVRLKTRLEKGESVARYRA